MKAFSKKCFIVGIMNIQQLKISNIPALLYGSSSEKIFIYVHGRNGRKEDANGFAEKLTPLGYQVLSFDLPEHGERQSSDYRCNVQNGVSDLRIIYQAIKDSHRIISLFACSLGAYFSLVAYSDIKFKKCMFLSPILDMRKLIENMMAWAKVSEEVLLQKKEINTEFGETLSWEYYAFVKEHPIDVWKSSTSILYAEKDKMTDKLTLDEFSKKFNCNIKIMKNGEHYFHTAEQVDFLNTWINEQEYE